MTTFWLMLGGYLLGSIPVGYLIVRWKSGADVRQTGSGATGATNVTRQAGRTLGLLTLFLDALKGALAVWLARAVLGEKDLAKYFGHGLGHGLGRDVHDFGGLSPLSNDTVAVGQVWTVEPGVYIEGFGGVRIEDDVHVSENGPVVLTHFPRELMELG